MERTWAGERRGEGPGGAPGPHPPAAVVAGRYRVEGELGAGAFATVYAAWDRVLHRRVALKAYPAADACLSVDEASLQARAQHPNVMPLHDAGCDALLGVAYLVMPLYGGGTLAERLARGPLPPGAAARVADQICGALTFLHDHRQVVHGDVKPANLWLTPTGAVLLMDFNLPGLRVRGGAGTGTPGYAAPEALAGAVDARSDVFSTGCVLYECLTGAPPFADDAAVLAGSPRPVRAAAPGVGAPLAQVVHTALAPNPERRYQSAQELRSALRRSRWQAGYRPDWYRIAGDLGLLARCLLRPGWRFLWWYLRYFCRRPGPALLTGACLAFVGWVAVDSLSFWARRHPGQVLLVGAMALALLIPAFLSRWRLR
jgi:serine/threonine protein kinase